MAALKNTLSDLNNHLFAQLERLGDEELTDDELEKEVARAEAISRIAGDVLDIANVQLRAASLSAEYGNGFQMTRLIGVEDGE